MPIIHAASYIVDSINDYVAWLYNINEESITDLMDDKGIRNFIGQKLHDYVSELCGQSDDGTISSDEIIDMLEENHDAVQEALHYNLLDADYVAIQEYLDSAFDWDELSVEALFQDHPQLLTLIGVLLSGWTIGGLLFSGILFLAGAVMTLKRYSRSAICVPIGCTCLASGVALIIVLALWNIFISMLNDAFMIGRTVYKLALYDVWGTLLRFTIGFLVAAIVFLAAAHLIRSIQFRTHPQAI